MVVLIRPPGPNLVHGNTFDLAPPEAAIRGNEFDIDLGRIRFIEPFGIVFLYWLVYHLIGKRAAAVRVHVPAALESYLERMDAIRLLEESPKVQVHRPHPAHRWLRRNRTDSLLELRIFRLRNDDEVEELAQQVMHILYERCPHVRGIRYELHLSLAELLSNIEVHSWTRVGALLVQSYGDRVHVAIGDGGVGIPYRLRSRDPEAADVDLIGLALEPHVSSRVGRGGMGLTELAGLVRQQGHYLAIRSGNGHVVVTPVRETRQGVAAPLPGTIVEVVW